MSDEEGSTPEPEPEARPAAKPQEGDALVEGKSSQFLPVNVAPAPVDSDGGMPPAEPVHVSPAEPAPDPPVDSAPAEAPEASTESARSPDE